MIKKTALIEFLKGFKTGDQIAFKSLKEALEGTESARCCNPSEYNLKALEHMAYTRMNADGVEMVDLASALTWLNREPLNREAGRKGRFGKVSEGFEVVNTIGGWHVTTDGVKVRVVSALKRVGRVTYDLTYTEKGKLRNNSVKWDLSLRAINAVHAAEEVAKEIVKRNKK